MHQFVQRKAVAAVSGDSFFGWGHFVHRNGLLVHGDGFLVFGDALSVGVDFLSMETSVLLVPEMTHKCQDTIPPLQRTHLSRKQVIIYEKGTQCLRQGGGGVMG